MLAVCACVSLLLRSHACEVCVRVVGVLECLL